MREPQRALQSVGTGLSEREYVEFWPAGAVASVNAKSSLAAGPGSRVSSATDPPCSYTHRSQLSARLGMPLDRHTRDRPCAPVY